MFYIVGTPIGNIQDASLRIVKTLVKADIILTEDTRTFDAFYKNIEGVFHVKKEKPQKIIHFHKENEFEKLASVLSILQEGKIVTLVSESGMPTISDPGSLLLTQVIKEHIPYTVIPGPTAFANALVLSGFSTKKVLFIGFLPKKKIHILQLLNKLKTTNEILNEITIVFYESPYRFHETLKTINDVFPNSEICICREMTKKFEEIIRGTAKELMYRTYKGEITVAITNNM